MFIHGGLWRMLIHGDLFFDWMITQGTDSKCQTGGEEMGMELQVKLNNWSRVYSRPIVIFQLIEIEVKDNFLGVL